MSDNRITVYDMVLRQDMYYKGVVILSYTVRYPLFISYRHQITLDKLNQYYKTEAHVRQIKYNEALQNCNG